jgi:hypothetical protein
VSIPTYNPLGGPQGYGAVTFNRSNFQYLDAGPRTFNIATNGGFTIVAVVRFAGLFSSIENILDLRVGTISEISLERSTHSSPYNAVQVSLCNAGIQKINPQSAYRFVEGVTWLTIMFTYRATIPRTLLIVNDYITVENVFSADRAMTDKQLTGMVIGANIISTLRGFSGDIAGVFVVDEYLTTDATTAIAAAMANGVDLTSTTCPSGNNCTAGPACNAGYTSSDGGVCVLCVAGKYKDATGSAACTNCTAGTYSTSVGASAAATCVACPVGTYSDIAGATACTPCPFGSDSSVIGSTTSASCFCSPGFFYNSSAGV